MAYLRNLVSLEVDAAQLAAVDAALKDLSRNVQTRIVKTALKAGADYMADRCRSAAPVRTGLMRDAVAVLSSRRRRGTIVFKAGFDVEKAPGLLKENKHFRAAERVFDHVSSRTGKRRTRWQARSDQQRRPNYFYPAAVEFGRRSRSTGVKVEGSHWMQHVVDQNAQTAADGIMRTALRLIDEYAAKAARKAARHEGTLARAASAAAEEVAAIIRDVEFEETLGFAT